MPIWGPFSNQVQQAINALINGCIAFVNLVVEADGYITWGSVKGTSGYGFRDNGGVIEYKDQGGAWVAFSSTWRPNQTRPPPS